MGTPWMDGDIFCTCWNPGAPVAGEGCLELLAVFKAFRAAFFLRAGGGMDATGEPLPAGGWDSVVVLI